MSLNHAGPIICTHEGANVVDCAACGFAHVEPLPTPEELKSEYEEEYYSSVKPGYIDSFKRDRDWWELSYSERYAAFESTLGPDRRRILDVGSGPGHFLLAGKTRGWDTLGIEPSRQASEYAKSLGLTIRREFLTEATADLGQFDVVHMSEVLEHIPDPAGLLRIVHKHLAPGGILCVVVPNDFNPLQLGLQKSLGFDPWWVSPKHHLNYFNNKSLESLMRKTGFDTFHSTTTFPIDLFLMMGDNYIGNDDIGRMAHGRRKTLELNMAKANLTALRLKMYKALSDLGLGRESIVYARRVSPS